MPYPTLASEDRQHALDVCRESKHIACDGVLYRGTWQQCPRCGARSVQAMHAERRARWVARVETLEPVPGGWKFAWRRQDGSPVRQAGEVLEDPRDRVQEHGPLGEFGIYFERRGVEYGPYASPEVVADAVIRLIEQEVFAWAPEPELVAKATKALGTPLMGRLPGHLFQYGDLVTFEGGPVFVLARLVDIDNGDCVWESARGTRLDMTDPAWVHVRPETVIEWLIGKGLAHSEGEDVLTGERDGLRHDWRGWTLSIDGEICWGTFAKHRLGLARNTPPDLDLARRYLNGYRGRHLVMK